MTPHEMWAFAQLCRRLTPRTPAEAQTLTRGIEWLELVARKADHELHLRGNSCA